MTGSRQPSSLRRQTLMDTSLNKMLGKATAGKLKRLGLETVRDLLYHFPRRYDRWGQLTKMSQLVEGVDVTVMARVADAQMRRTRMGRTQLSVTITDGAGVMDVVFWAKHPNMLRGHQARLAVGETFYFAGKVGRYRNRLQLTYPDYDAASGGDRNIEAPIPIYPSTKGLTSWVLAKAIDTVLLPLNSADVDDPIPEDVRRREGLPHIVEAFSMIHHPETSRDHARAYRRFQYEEALVLQTLLAQRRHSAQSTPAPQLAKTAGPLEQALMESLPFQLTSAQRQAIDAINDKASTATPSNVLLQGDVGAGKTLVALFAMVRALDCGYQAAMLAPTSVLARQHWQSIIGYMGALAPVELLTSATPAASRQALLSRLEAGEPMIVVGTHALLTEGVALPNAAMIIVDEQHRFGVAQRDVLRTRSHAVPHTLVMTATPIPRTVAMTVFGDMDTITLAQMPHGRKETATFVVPHGNRAWMERLWQRAQEEIDGGGRVFAIVPRVEENEGEKAKNVSSIEQMKAELPTLMPGTAFSVVTGAMKDADKQEAMNAFASGRTPLLLATTVVEVGVDVPEATMMIIIDADFFGLSQLHQLRGRVGRGTKPSICMATTSAPEGSPARQRLDVFASTNDGFRLAEEDLRLRKEGNILGAQQSGRTSSLKTLSLGDGKTIDIIKSARAAAWDIVEGDPMLERHAPLKDAIERIDSEEEAFLERG